MSDKATPNIPRNCVNGRFGWSRNTVANNRAYIHDLATGRYLDEKVAILIVGQTGTGIHTSAYARTCPS